MADFFGRKIEILCEGLKITNDFDVSFDIPFDDGPNIDVSRIKIYNLLDTTIRKFANGKQLIVNAGYPGMFGTCLKGTIKKVTTEWEGPDKLTTITVADSTDNWLGKSFNKTYAADVYASTIIRDAANAVGISIARMALPTNKIYKGGKTVKDEAGKTIAEIVPDCNAKLHVSEGRLYIAPRNEGTPTGILLNKNSGLIGTPVAISKEETYKEGKDDKERSRILYGWKVRMILNHRVKPDSIIKIESSVVTGEFRVVVGKHDGDDFITEVEAYQLISDHTYDAFYLNDINDPNRGKPGYRQTEDGSWVNW